MSLEDIPTVGLTGGPGGGKTTSKSFLVNRLSSFGHTVFVVPETATTLILGGANPREMTEAQKVTFQSAILHAQLAMEDAFLMIAADAKHAGKKPVVLCDRGAVDGQAFISPEGWQAVLDRQRVSHVSLRDQRYTAIIHLVTAANGAEHAYTLENNAARSESKEEARAADERILKAYMGHSHLRVIDNSTDFAGKIHRAAAVVCEVLGYPEPIEDEQKLLVRLKPNMIPVNHVTVNIEQRYLDCDRQVEEERIRRRGQDSHCVYFHTRKVALEGSKRIEHEKMITPREYIELMNRQVGDTVVKTRTCFLWKNVYQEYDKFTSPSHIDPRIQFLEIEAPANSFEVPDFFEVLRDVTHHPRCKNAAIARGSLRGVSLEMLANGAI